MTFIPLTFPNVKDRTLSLITAALNRSLAPLLSKSHLDSIIIGSVTLTSGAPVAVPHMLGRKLSGWRTVRQRGDARLWDSQDDANVAKSPELFLYLNASAAVVIDLEVF